MSDPLPCLLLSYTQRPNQTLRPPCFLPRPAPASPQRPKQTLGPVPSPLPLLLPLAYTTPPVPPPFLRPSPTPHQRPNLTPSLPPPLIHAATEPDATPPMLVFLLDLPCLATATEADAGPVPSSSPSPPPARLSISLPLSALPPLDNNDHPAPVPASSPSRRGDRTRRRTAPFFPPRPPLLRHSDRTRRWALSPAPPLLLLPLAPLHIPPPLYPASPSPQRPPLLPSKPSPLLLPGVGGTGA